MPLRIVGADLPNPDDIMRTAFSSYQRGLATGSAVTQQVAQLSSQATEALVAANTARAAAAGATYMAEAQKDRNQQGLADLGEAIYKTLGLIKEESSARQRERAYRDLMSLQNQAREIIDVEGEAGYERRALAILDSYPDIDHNDKLQLLQLAYQHSEQLSKVAGERKAKLEFLDAFDRIQDLQINAVDIINNHGYTYYNSKVDELLGSYSNLQPEHILELKRMAVDPALDLKQRQILRAEEEQEKVNAMVIDSRVQELNLKLAGIYSKLVVSQEDASELLAKGQNIVSEYIASNDNITAIEAISLQRAYLTEASKRLQFNEDAKAKVQEQLNQSYLAESELVDLVAKYRAGMLTPQQFEAEKFRVTSKYGLVSGSVIDRIGDPFAAEREAVMQSELQSRLGEIHQHGLLNELSSVEVNNGWVGSNAWKVIQNPDMRPIIEARAKTLPQYRQVLAVADRYIQYEKEKKESLVKIAQLQKDIAVAEAATLSSLRSGEVMRSWLQRLLTDGIVDPGITDEATSATNEEEWLRARSAIIDAIKTQIEIEQNNINATASYLRNYGLDKGAASIVPFEEKYRQNIALVDQAFAQVQATYLNRQLANPPNFRPGIGGSGSNAGVLETPLPRGALKFNGTTVKITPDGLQALPITDGTIVQGGGRFGADRPGERRHMGQDIATKAGTPVHVVTEGLVIEIKTLDQVANSYAIKLRTADGAIEEYLHVTPVEGLRVGQLLPAGTVLATVSKKDKLSSGEHLHFGRSENGRYVDPLPYLERIRKQVKPQNLGVLMNSRRLDSTNVRMSTPGLVNEHPNVRALADLIAFTEGTGSVGKVNGYDVYYSYAFPLDISKPHPGVRLPAPGGTMSSAAGRYQFIDTTWASVWGGQNVPMTPENQDKAYVRYLKQLGVYDEVLAGKWDEVFSKLGRIWTSLPGGIQPNSNTAKALEVLRERINYYSNGGIQTKPTTADPIRVETVNPKFTGRNDASANYGYKALAVNEKARVRLARVGEKLGLSGVLLADAIALATNGEFSFVDKSVDDTIEHFAGLLEASKYKLNTPERLVAFLVGGDKLVNTYAANPYNTLKTHAAFRAGLQKLGEHGGRVYSTIANRTMQAARLVDTTPTPGCRLCAEMQKNGQPITPHETQF